jgi:hypothetical protein
MASQYSLVKSNKAGLAGRTHYRPSIFRLASIICILYSLFWWGLAKLLLLSLFLLFHVSFFMGKKKLPSWKADGNYVESHMDYHATYRWMACLSFISGKMPLALAFLACGWSSKVNKVKTARSQPPFLAAPTSAFDRRPTSDRCLFLRPNRGSTLGDRVLQWSLHATMLSPPYQLQAARTNRPSRRPDGWRERVGRARVSVPFFRWCRNLLKLRSTHDAVHPSNFFLLTESVFNF